MGPRNSVSPSNTDENIFIDDAHPEPTGITRRRKRRIIKRSKTARSPNKTKHKFYKTSSVESLSPQSDGDISPKYTKSQSYVNRNNRYNDKPEPPDLQRGSSAHNPIFNNKKIKINNLQNNGN